MKSFCSLPPDTLSFTKLSSIIDVERFYMEEDMKEREREKCPLSFNIMSHAPHTSIIELNLKSFVEKRPQY